MEEIKALVKKHKHEEIKQQINEIDKENYKTKDYLLKQLILKNTINDEVIKIVGEQMIEYEEELEEKQCLIDEYQNITGDDKINNELVNKANKQYIEQIDPSKTTYKERIGKRLLNKLNKKIKELQ